MKYKLEITLEGEERIENQIVYLMNEKKNPFAASHLMDEIEKMYDRIETNPLLFPLSKDRFLRMMGYREAIFPNMNYKMIFKIDDSVIYIVGLFHDLENYSSKLK